MDEPTRRLRVAREESGRLLPPSYVVTDDEGAHLMTVNREFVDFGSADGDDRGYVRHRRGHCQLIADHGATIVGAERTTGVFRRPRVYRLTWGDGRHAELLVWRPRHGNHKMRRTAELRRGDLILDRTRLDYVDETGEWEGSAREHDARVTGVIDVAADIPDEVVAMCLLLDLGGWSTFSPRVGHWTQRRIAPLGGDD